MQATPPRLREAPVLASLDPIQALRRPTAASARDLEFLLMAERYRAFGGLATSAEMSARLPDIGISRLARGIVAREIVSFEWRGDYWLPRFQFEGEGLAVDADTTVLIAELSAALDDWELAQWFVTPNAWLGERMPVQAMVTDFASVHDAARCLRFTCAN